MRTIGSMTIEFGELLAYLFLLKNSPSVVIVSFILFSIEVLVHAIHIQYWTKLFGRFCFAIALGPAIESITKLKYEYEQGQMPRVTILLVWTLICATLYFIMYSIPLSMTGVVFAIQQFRELTPSYQYDFIVYLSSFIFVELTYIFEENSECNF
ncbi:unnamed protein product [Rotaria sp. Silwood1]|nr:unnamed protein product [Rotaria sp. Silwood1]